MHQFLQQLANGISLGSTYALIALGFAIVYSVLRMVNFAHGNVYVFGVFVTVVCIDAGVPSVLSVLAGIASGAALAVLVERVAYRPLRNAHPMMPLLTSVAAALVIKQVTALLFGLETKPFPQVFPSPVHIFGIQISGTNLLSLGVAIVTFLGVTQFLRHARWGRAIILMRQDLEVSQLMGIGAGRMVSVVYAIGGGLGVVGGLLTSTTYGAVNVEMGFQGTVDAFIACILGGLGGLQGAVVGGLVLGIIHTMTASYISASYEVAISFGVLVLVLLVRPGGLFPPRTSEARV